MTMAPFRLSDGGPKRSLAALLSLCIIASLVVSGFVGFFQEDAKPESEGEALKNRILKAFDGVPGHEDFGPYGSNGLILSTSEELKPEYIGTSRSIRQRLMGKDGIKKFEQLHKTRGQEDKRRVLDKTTKPSKSSNGGSYYGGERSEWNVRSDWGETRALKELYDRPWMDGSAALLRRDATKVRIFDGFYAENTHGFFGFFWDPVKNSQIAKCVYPIDAWSTSRGTEVGTSESKVVDRCSNNFVKNEKDPCPPPDHVVTLNSFMCDDEQEEGASCLQRAFKAKVGGPQYRDFMHKCKSVEWVMDCSHMELVLSRDQETWETEGTPRPTGWLWGHKGPKLKSQEELNEDSELKDLLCGLRRWDKDTWQPTGTGLEQSKYLLQIVYTNEYAGDTKAEEIFELIDLDELCTEE